MSSFQNQENPEIIKTLQNTFGFETFRAGQQKVISKILGPVSCAAIFPTGSGKSLCYQLPALFMPGITLVVSPLISLMKDQLDFLEEKGIAAAKIDSTLQSHEYNQIINNAVNNRLKILMISVERFKNERFRIQLKRMNISLLVVDEAHCISEWGHNFRPEYLKIPSYAAEFNIKTVLLLTATATTEVTKDMCGKFDIPDENIIRTGFYRENLFLNVLPVNPSEKAEKLLKIIGEHKLPAIIYVTQQKTAEKITCLLNEAGINAKAYHAGLKSDERNEIQNSFMEGRCPCIAATIAFGMGIDKSDIRSIIHYDLPKSIEGYSQEIGRAGRDGKPSKCTILGCMDNVNILQNFIYGDTPEKRGVSKLLEMIKNCDEPRIEFMLTSLSKEVDIKPLPLKTLLVYLDLLKIIIPETTYFRDYKFVELMPREEIFSTFDKNRSLFLKSLFENSNKKKKWTHADINVLTKKSHSPRNRVVAALDYMDQQGMISLDSKQAVEVFKISDKKFDVKKICEKIFTLFHKKEISGINRINEMTDFLESKSCLSLRLAAFFNDYPDMEKCNHCSVCMGKTAKLDKLPPADFDRQELMEIFKDFQKLVKNDFSERRLTKYLCGINTPVFFKYKLSKTEHFGIFSNLPFNDVECQIKKLCSNISPEVA